MLDRLVTWPIRPGSGHRSSPICRKFAGNGMGWQLSKRKIKDSFLCALSFGVLPVTLARILVPVLPLSPFSARQS